MVEMVVDAPTLRAWRTYNGMTCAQAALVLGINRRTYEGLESGRYHRSPLWRSIGRIIDLLDALAEREMPGT